MLVRYIYYNITISNDYKKFKFLLASYYIYNMRIWNYPPKTILIWVFLEELR